MGGVGSVRWCGWRVGVGEVVSSGWSGVVGGAGSERWCGVVAGEVWLVWLQGWLVARAVVGRVKRRTGVDATHRVDGAEYLVDLADLVVLVEVDRCVEIRWVGGGTVRGGRVGATACLEWAHTRQASPTVPQLGARTHGGPSSSSAVVIAFGRYRHRPRRRRPSPTRRCFHHHRVSIIS